MRPSDPLLDRIPGITKDRGFVRVEENALLVLQSIARVKPELEPILDWEIERTRDVIQVNAGGETGIIILVTPEAIEIRMPTVEWTLGSYGPGTSSSLWQRVELDSGDAEWLDATIKAGFEIRERGLRQCRFCDQRFPTDRMHNDDVCHGCAEKHLGVIH